jgi:hypothetical protein
MNPQALYKQAKSQATSCGIDTPRKCLCFYSPLFLINSETASLNTLHNGII